MTTAIRTRGQVCHICGEAGTKSRRVQVVDGTAAHKTCRPKRTCARPRCAADEHARGLCSSHYNKQYYAADPEAQRDRARQWARLNPDRVAERNRARDRAAQAAASRAWYQANRMRALAAAHNKRAAQLGVSGTVTAEQLFARLTYYGHRCYLCTGTPNGFDHVKPLAANGPHLASNLRPVCGTCNSRKGTSWKGDA